VINSLDVKGFKRIKHKLFDFAPLTILAGLNGAGKTSLIQTLLLIKKASESPLDAAISLNGPFGLELGLAEDVRNWESEDFIQFDVKSELDIDSIWRFTISSEDALYINSESKPNEIPFAFTTTPRAFTYLCAERLGPRSILGAAPRSGADLEIGVRGEYCAQLLESIGDKLITDMERVHPEHDPSAAHLLKYEVEQWLSEITRPVEIDAARHPKTAVFTLRFRTPGGEWVSAPNMGFGLSYALPIVLAGLTAEKHGLLIVENPEAHLHPAGQSRMGTFLGWLASRGVQVIIETHSDHVLNGCRRAIGEYKFLRSSDATVHFFDVNDKNSLHVEKLDFTPIGGISHWPAGFFDQYQTDISILGRIRRGV